MGKKKKKKGRKRGEWDPLGDISGLLSGGGSFTLSIIHRLMKSGKLAFRTEPKPFLPYCTISLISISAAEHIPPLLPVIGTSVSHITEVPECIYAHVYPRQVCVRVCPTSHKTSPAQSEGVK